MTQTETAGRTDRLSMPPAAARGLAPGHAGTRAQKLGLAGEVAGRN
jgi:hypothetical protein